MDAADHILLAIDAKEVLTGLRVAEREDPIVVRHGGPDDDFGTVGGQYSVAELQDLLALWQYRMGQLGQAYANASPSWVAKDPSAFIDFTNDWNALQARYAAALKAAQTALGMASYYYVTVPNSLIPANAEYVGLMKAMRQCAPPDGCPVQKGDWADLFARLSAVTQVIDHPPQPKATDADVQAFKATAQADVVAQVSGAQLAGPLPASVVTGLQNPFVWMARHKTALVMGAAALAVLVLVPVLLPPLKLLKGAAALAV